MVKKRLPYLGRKMWKRILEDTLDDVDVQYKQGPFLLKEEKLKLKNRRYRTDYGYIDGSNGIIVINCNLPEIERKITLNHELIHERFPQLKEATVEDLAVNLFKKYGIGYDFYRKKYKSKKKSKGK